MNELQAQTVALGRLMIQQGIAARSILSLAKMPAPLISWEDANAVLEWIKGDDLAAPEWIERAFAQIDLAIRSNTV